MLTVDRFALIRQRYRDGLTVRQIAAELGHSPKTILKALANPEPPPDTRSTPRPAPVFGPFEAIVDAILDADEHAPRKQRHTATQIFRRLVQEHHYTGSYHPVQRYLKDQRRDRRETFVPLDHAPGQRCEADFGHIHVDIPEGRLLVPVLILTWSYSNAPFAIALPTERTEAILHGMAEAFGFFGGVPREVWWDNPATVAIHVGRGRERTLHPRYAALCSHYSFAGRFCLPATPREKPRVENRVKDLERMWATPVPQVKDLAALNEHLRRCCLQARERTCGTNTETVGVRFTRDLAAAGPLSLRPFEACVFGTGVVDKYQTVAFDGNRYSVPRRYAFRSVTVKGFVDRVEIVADHQAVASHVRSYGSHQRVLNPLHFLAILEQKPATLDHAPVYRDWALPAVFTALRTDLERRLGPRAGVRQYIQVLQLLARFSLDHVTQAVTVRLARGDPTVASITTTAERLVQTSDTAMSPRDARLSQVTVPRPDLARFDRLLPRSPEGIDHDRSKHDAVEGEPQDPQVADGAGRVREAGSGGSQSR
ncbi:IS21 family transposase [Fimbriiglobus ruber]|uniref:Mobile element protein n=1 Tax=Fimbriiglobus ruber TaxID=1908690 RepID=A0A225DY11_9BACT|nr:IS21 family transposase [Fimbriiglobus ruber]OWK41007.1 Mobile element protein [Fimbriiglobus ruber]OWK41284.1 Mobile element protein [Fimbriiglobus ruber]